jgi:Ca2+-binding RTX toxin-like protein
MSLQEYYSGVNTSNWAARIDYVAGTIGAAPSYETINPLVTTRDVRTANLLSTYESLSHLQQHVVTQAADFPASQTSIANEISSVIRHGEAPGVAGVDFSLFRHFNMSHFAWGTFIGGAVPVAGDLMQLTVTAAHASQLRAAGDEVGYWRSVAGYAGNMIGTAGGAALFSGGFASALLGAYVGGEFMERLVLLGFDAAVAWGPRIFSGSQTPQYTPALLDSPDINVANGVLTVSDQSGRVWLEAQNTGNGVQLFRYDGNENRLFNVDVSSAGQVAIFQGLPNLGTLTTRFDHNNVVGFDVHDFAHRPIAHAELMPGGIRVTQFFNPDGGTSTTTVDQFGDFWRTEIADYQNSIANELNGLDLSFLREGNTRTVQIGSTVMQAPQIGATLGSAFGRVLASEHSDNQFVSAGAETLGGAVGHFLGQQMRFNMFSTALNATGDAALIQSGSAALRSFQPDFVGSLVTVGAGQLSSLLFAELAEELGLDGFAGALFQSAGTTITTQLVTNAYQTSINALVPGTNEAYTMFTGLDPASLFTSMGGALVSYFDDYLIAQIVQPDSQEAALTASIGSSIGALLGGIFIPIPGVGSAIGSFVGQLAGTIVGNVLSEDPRVQGIVGLDETSNQLVITFPFTGTFGGNPAVLREIAEQSIDAVNALVAFTGGLIDPTQSHPQTGYFQDGTDFWIQEHNGEIPFIDLDVTNLNDLAPMIGVGIMAMISNIVIEGGDMVMRAAWDASDANNVSAFATDLQVGQDYRTYLDNAVLINAIMAAEPDSVFTAGWALTLLRAEELGLPYIFVGSHSAHDVIRGGTHYDPLEGRDGNDQLFGEGGDDYLRGEEGNDHLEGGADDDTLDGGTSGDWMAGGIGHDTYHVDHSGDDVIENPDEGSDLIIVRGTHLVLPANVEDLTLAPGAGGLQGIGNELANNIIGNESGNTLRGLGGDDRLSGGDDVDVLYGDDGDDILNGGNGRDILIGGIGNDTYVVDVANEDVREDNGEGTDTIRTSLAIFSLAPLAAYIENLTGTSDNGQTLTGEGGANIITAGAGDDILDGQAGNDTLRGGSGADTYYVDANDVIEEENGGGTDRVIASTTFVLPNLVEHLTLAAGAGGINGTGNAAQNDIYGNASPNELRGEAEDDELYGYGGADILRGGTSHDSLFGGDNNDLLHGDDGNDLLQGEDGNDVLVGGPGSDALDGGTGIDVADYGNSDAGVAINLTISRFTGGDAEGDVLSSIENVAVPTITTSWWATAPQTSWPAAPATMFCTDSTGPTCWKAATAATRSTAARAATPSRVERAMTRMCSPQATATTPSSRRAMVRRPTAYGSTGSIRRTSR